MALSDKARDFWDRISPRERMMVVVLAVALPIGGILWLGLSIRDGLVSIEKRNEQHREALDTIARFKAQGGPVTEEPGVKIPDAPIALQSYVSKALTKYGLTNKGSIDERKVVKNGITTTTVSCAVNEMSTDQLKTFLQEIETAEKVVAVTHLDVKRNRRDSKKIDATFEISTYSNANPSKPVESEDKKDDGKKEGG